MNSELDQYRKDAIATLKREATFIRTTAIRVLGLPVEGVYIIGSVLDSKKFTENSDIDVGIVVRGDGTGINHHLSEKLQYEMINHPFGDIGVVNTSVYLNKLTAYGKTIRLGGKPKTKVSETNAELWIGKSPKATLKFSKPE